MNGLKIGRNVLFWFLLAGVSQASLITSDPQFIQTSQIGNMAKTSSYDPLPYYHYTFGSGSGDIHDGSDFQAVRNAFQTWIDEPTSGLSASEVLSSGSRSSGYNGVNEVSWINPTAKNRDPWSGLGLNSSAIASVVTWYNSATHAVLERDLFFNNVNYHWRTDTDGQQVGGFYVEGIALHEIGHIFGLRDLYNPGQSGWQSWMGEDNAGYTMYGYTNWRNEDITLSFIDVAAMAMLHPSTQIPEPRSMSVVTLAAGVLLVIRRP